MRINELFSVLHFPWSGNSQCLGSIDLLLAIASDTLKILGLCYCSLCSAQGCWELGRAKQFTLTGMSSCTCISVSGCFQERQLYQQGAAFAWIHREIAASRESWGISALLLQAGWQWVNGHVQLEQGDAVWFCLLGCQCVTGFYGSVHCLEGTSHMEYSPKVHICLRLSFQRFQILAIFWRDYPVLAGHTFLSSFRFFIFLY